MSANNTNSGQTATTKEVDSSSSNRSPTDAKSPAIMPEGLLPDPSPVKPSPKAANDEPRQSETNSSGGEDIDVTQVVQLPTSSEKRYEEARQMTTKNWTVQYQYNHQSVPPKGSAVVMQVDQQPYTTPCSRGAQNTTATAMVSSKSRNNSRGPEIFRDILEKWQETDQQRDPCERNTVLTPTTSSTVGGLPNRTIIDRRRFPTDACALPRKQEAVMTKTVVPASSAAEEVTDGVSDGAAVLSTRTGAPRARRSGVAGPVVDAQHQSSPNKKVEQEDCRIDHAIVVNPVEQPNGDSPSSSLAGDAGQQQNLPASAEQQSQRVASSSQPRPMARRSKPRIAEGSTTGDNETQNSVSLSTSQDLDAERQRPLERGDGDRRAARDNSQQAPAIVRVQVRGRKLVRSSTTTIHTHGGINNNYGGQGRQEGQGGQQGGQEGGVDDSVIPTTEGVLLVGSGDGMASSSVSSEQHRRGVEQSSVSNSNEQQQQQLTKSDLTNLLPSASSGNVRAKRPLAMLSTRSSSTNPAGVEGSSSSTPIAPFSWLAASNGVATSRKTPRTVATTTPMGRAIMTKTAFSHFDRPSNQTRPVIMHNTTTPSSMSAAAAIQYSSTSTIRSPHQHSQQGLGPNNCSPSVHYPQQQQQQPPPPPKSQQRVQALSPVTNLPPSPPHQTTSPLRQQQQQQQLSSPTLVVRPSLNVSQTTSPPPTLSIRGSIPTTNAAVITFPVVMMAAAAAAAAPGSAASSNASVLPSAAALSGAASSPTPANTYRLICPVVQTQSQLMLLATQTAAVQIPSTCCCCKSSTRKKHKSVRRSRKMIINSALRKNKLLRNIRRSSARTSAAGQPPTETAATETAATETATLSTVHENVRRKKILRKMLVSERQRYKKLRQSSKLSADTLSAILGKMARSQMRMEVILSSLAGEKKEKGR